jgi:16S rRNA (guanine966-N2)-methyltransferase
VDNPREPPVRVIAGSLGGRRLKAPRGLRTRPTSDRVREALFMALEPLTGARVVDLYAGSGALGIEALSRGAARADFVDSDRTAREALEANLASLGLGGRARVWPLALPAGIARIRDALRAADLVLADPPYGGRVAAATLGALGAEGVLAPGVRVVVEHHGKDELPEAAGVLRRVRQRSYGETVVSTYRWEAPGAGAETRGGGPQ